MFVQARQAPVDAQPGVCVVQELTNLYLERVMRFRKVHVLQRATEPMYAGQARHST